MSNNFSGKSASEITHLLKGNEKSMADGIQKMFSKIGKFNYKSGVKAGRKKGWLECLFSLLGLGSLGFATYCYIEDNKK